MTKSLGNKDLENTNQYSNRYKSSNNRPDVEFWEAGIKPGAKSLNAPSGQGAADSAGKYFSRLVDAAMSPLSKSRSKAPARSKYNRMNTPAALLQSPASASWHARGEGGGIPYRLMEEEGPYESSRNSLSSCCVTCLGHCSCTAICGSFGRKCRRAACGLLEQLGFRFSTEWRKNRRSRRRRRSSRASSGADADAAPATSARRHNAILAALAVMLVAFVALERILVKVLSDHARVGNVSADIDYRYIVAQCVVLFNIIMPVMWLLFNGISTSKTSKTRVTCDMLSGLPKCHAAILALLSALQHLTMFISMGAVPAPVAVIVTQTALPFSVIFSRIFARRVFTATHCVGAVVVLAGVALAVIPVVTRSGEELGGASWCISSDQEYPTCWGSTLMLASSGVLSALTLAWQEWMLSLRGAPIPPAALALWVLPLEFIWGVFLSPVARHAQRPLSPWGNITVEMHGITTYISNGFDCVFRGNTSGIYVVPTWKGADFPMLCDPILIMLLAYVVVGWVLVALSASVLRRGGFYLVQLCNVCAIVLAWSALVVYASNIHSWEWPLHPSFSGSVSWMQCAAVALVAGGSLAHYFARSPPPPPPEAQTPVVSSPM